MTDLTEEMKAQGWRPIADIVNEPIGALFECMGSKILRRLNAADKEDYQCRIASNKRSLYDFYRRLVPVTPDAIMISREDAEALISYSGGAVAWEYFAAQARLRAQLEGKE